ncbi:tetratricopeptide repeat-containing sulfotransferase family protein [Novosphingobium sp.]|uniref:tetratricopeptide repeat-containing sulfotransferase family protein n=1 Tax=Novosphingobium sp. TaxID=1874826 RepID=UPI002630AF95|nr:tetratricopeptide repeat-containing sulfotransferase family protein [Novosphingobium sp.]
MTEPALTPEMIGQALMARRYADAAVLLKAWVDRYPDDADGWFNLGYSLRQLLQAEPALHAYRRAIEVGITEPEQVWLNMAAIQAEVLQDVPGARASLQAALALEPGFVLAWQNLGQLEEDVGDAAAARAAYEAALRHAPGLGRAHARIAGIDVFEGRAAEGLARVEQAAAQAPTRDDLIELAFAGANALDALGRHDEAFAQARDANALQKGATLMLHRQGDVTAQIDAMIRLFPAEPLPDLPAEAAPEVAPIFLCGLFRSGSTLLESLLHRHTGVTMGGELAYTPWFMTQYGQHITPATVNDAATRFREDYASFARAVLGGAKVFTDKRMDNFLYLGLIKRAFPAARIVHVQRDPLDTFISMYFLPFADSLTYANDFDDMLHYYREYRRLMAHWQDCFGDDILSVRYEELVDHPEAVIAGLARRLGLASGTAPEADQIIRTASVWQVRQPIHARSRGRWRNYAGHIGEIAALLRAEFPEFSG